MTTPEIERLCEEARQRGRSEMAEQDRRQLQDSLGRQADWRMTWGDCILAVETLATALAAVAKERDGLREAIAKACNADLLDVWDEAFNVVGDKPLSHEYTDDELVAAFLVQVAALTEPKPC